MNNTEQRTGDFWVTYQGETQDIGTRHFKDGARILISFDYKHPINIGDAVLKEDVENNTFLPILYTGGNTDNLHRIILVSYPEDESFQPISKAEYQKLQESRSN